MHRLLLAENSVPAANVVANTAADTAFASLIPMPANNDSLSNAGRLYKLKAHGYLSSLATGQGTLTLKIKMGSTVLGQSAAIALPASLANNYWNFDAFALICTTGSSGKLSCQGGGFIDNNGAPVSFGFVNTGTVAAGQITYNTQAASSLLVSATFSVASASNTITLAQLLAEELTV